MKKIFLLLFLSAQLISCTEPSGPEPSGLETENPGPQNRMVTGKVTDATGRPLANAEVVANNTQFYNNKVAKTDANGRYRIELENGSWYMRASVKVPYAGQPSQFDLLPDNPGAFAGSEGAVCNFKWQLSGPRTGEFGDGGNYGGSVAVFRGGNDWGFDLAEVELTMTPIVLADGTKGEVVRKSLTGIEGGDDGIADIPIGRYRVTARNTQSGRVMQIRVRNAGQSFQSSVTTDFKVVVISRYRVELEVGFPD
jgi:hypothetical protein